MSQLSKYDQFINEVDSTLWPVPGQSAANKQAVYKSIPSIQSLLQTTPDTDPLGTIGAAVHFPAPLQQILEESSGAYQALQSLKNRFIEAKATPVYQGREGQQALLDEIIQRIERMQVFLFKTVDKMDGLSLASLGDDIKLSSETGTTGTS